MIRTILLDEVDSGGGTGGVTIDAIPDILDHPDFQSSSFEDRNKIAENALNEASTNLKNSGEWNQDSYKNFTEVANLVRDKVAKSKTTMESVKGAAYVPVEMGIGLERSATGAAVDASPYLGGHFRVPFQDAYKVLDSQMGKLVSSADTLAESARNKIGWGNSGPELDKSIEGLRKKLDSGDFPFEPDKFAGWIQDQNADIGEKAAKWHEAADPQTTDPAARQAYAVANGLQAPRNAQLLAQYLHTRDPKAWEQLRQNLQETPSHAAASAAQQKVIETSPTVGAVNALFSGSKPLHGGTVGEEALHGAGDPINAAALVLPLLKGAGAAEGQAFKQLLKGQLEAQAFGEASLLAENPNATLSQHWDNAKNMLFGALGMHAAGAVAGKVLKRFTKDESTQPGTDQPTPPDAKAPEVQVPPSVELVTPAGEAPVAPEQPVAPTVAPQIEAQGGKLLNPAPEKTATAPATTPPILESTPSRVASQQPKGQTIAHADIDAVNERLGLPPRVRPDEWGVKATQEEALRRMDAMPDYADRIIQRFVENPKERIDPIEAVVLNKTIQTQEKIYTESLDRLQKLTPGTPEHTAELARFNAVDEAFKTSKEIVNSAGSEWGSEGRARQTFLREYDSPANQIAKIEAKTGIKASLEDKQKASSQFKKLDELRTKQEKVDAERETLKANSESEAELPDLKQEVVNETKADFAADKSVIDRTRTLEQILIQKERAKKTVFKPATEEQKAAAAPSKPTIERLSKEERKTKAEGKAAAAELQAEIAKAERAQKDNLHKGTTAKSGISDSIHLEDLKKRAEDLEYLNREREAAAKRTLEDAKRKAELEREGEKAALQPGAPQLTRTGIDYGPHLKWKAEQKAKGGIPTESSKEPAKSNENQSQVTKPAEKPVEAAKDPDRAKYDDIQQRVNAGEKLERGSNEATFFKDYGLKIKIEEARAQIAELRKQADSPESNARDKKILEDRINVKLAEIEKNIPKITIKHIRRSAQQGLHMEATGLLLATDVVRTMARQAKDIYQFASKAINHFGDWIKPHIKELWARVKQGKDAVHQYFKDVVARSQEGSIGDNPEARAAQRKAADAAELSEHAEYLFGVLVRDKAKKSPAEILNEYKKKFPSQDANAVYAKALEMMASHEAKKAAAKSPEHIVKNAKVDQAKPIDGAIARKLAKAHLKQNINLDVKALNDLVTRDMSKMYGRQLDPSEVQRARVGYGKKIKPSTDPIDARLRELNAQGNEIEKLRDLQKGERPKGKGYKHDEPSVEVKGLRRQVFDKLNEMFPGIVSPQEGLIRSQLEKREATITNRIKDLEADIAKIQRGEKPEVRTGQRVGTTPKIDALLAEKTRLEKVRSKTLEEQGMKDETMLNRYKKRMEATRKKYEAQKKEVERTGKKPEKKTPREIKLDEEAQKLALEAGKASFEYKKTLAELELKNRSKTQFIIDRALRVPRAAMLSGYHILVTLTNAAMTRSITNPIETAIAGGIGKLPFLNQIASKAPRWGKFSMESEMAAAKGIWKGIKEMPEVIRTGKGATAKAHGKIDPHHDLDQSLLGIPGHIHAALKNPAKIAEFERSLAMRIAHDKAKGLDTESTSARLLLTAEAYLDAERAISQQPNAINSMVASQMMKLKAKYPPGTIHPMEAVLKVLFPITKVPMNILLETGGSYVAGLPRGAFEAAMAFRNGLDNLKPHQADAIQRHLAKGAVGAAAMAAMWFLPGIAGGFYRGMQEEKKQKKHGMTPPDRFRMGKEMVPKELTHFPLALAAQFIETLHEVADEVDKETGKPKGYSAGLQEGILGFIESSPWERGSVTTTDMLKSTKQGKHTWINFAGSRVMPQFLREVAKDQDRMPSQGIFPGEVRKRETPNIWQDAIPDFGFGLPIPSRNQLPLKK